MMEDVSRTVLALANLAIFSLLATIISIGAAHAASSKGSALCRACLDYRITKAAEPGRLPKTPAPSVVLAARAI